MCPARRNPSCSRTGGFFCKKKLSNIFQKPLDYCVYNMYNTMQNELVVTFDKPLFGEAKAYANEALDAAVSYVQTLVGLKHRPNFDIISPFKATVKKYFAETDFARE